MNWNLYVYAYTAKRYILRKRLWGLAVYQDLKKNVFLKLKKKELSLLENLVNRVKFNLNKVLGVSVKIWWCFSESLEGLGFWETKLWIKLDNFFHHIRVIQVIDSNSTQTVSFCLIRTTNSQKNTETTENEINKSDCCNSLDFARPITWNNKPVHKIERNWWKLTTTDNKLTKFETHFTHHKTPNLSIRRNTVFKRFSTLQTYFYALNYEFVLIFIFGWNIRHEDNKFTQFLLLFLVLFLHLFSSCNSLCACASNLAKINKNGCLKVHEMGLRPRWCTPNHCVCFWLSGFAICCPMETWQT